MIRNLRFDVPDGRYEMKFENYYGSSGNITGEFNLTEDWKEFQKNNDSLRCKYGLRMSAQTTMDEFITKVRSYSRSVYVCDGYLIVPKWAKIRMREHVMRTCISVDDARVEIHFRISDLDYGSKQICYMVDAPYVGRIVTKHDYKNFDGDILLHQQLNRWIEMTIFPITSADKEKLLKDKTASTKVFKGTHDLWYYQKDGKLSLKARVSKIQHQAMFRGEQISLPTPSGPVQVRLQNHVLPFKFRERKSKSSPSERKRKQTTDGGSSSPKRQKPVAV